MLRRLLVLTIGILVSCKKHEAPPKVVEEPLKVEVAGCAAVVKGPICQLAGERALRMWIDAPETATPVVRAGDVVAVTGAARVDDGWMLPKVVVPAGASNVRVEAANRVFTLSVADAQPLPWLDEAKALRQSGKLDEAAARLEATGLRETGAAHARALGLLARIELARGKMDEATARFGEAIGEDRANGLVSEAALDTFAMTYVLTERGHHYAEARAALDAIADLLPLDAEQRASEPYYRGLIARNTGDLRSALPLLRDAEMRAARLGMTRPLLASRQTMGLVLNELGRSEEALSLYDLTSKMVGIGPCDRIAMDLNRGDVLLMLGEHGDSSRIREAKAVLQGAMQLVDSECSDALTRSSLYAEAVRADLGLDETEAATADLAKARAATTSRTGEFAEWLLDLEGRVALRRRDSAAALKAFDAEAKMAESSCFASGRWPAMVGRGAALELRGSTVEAVASYEDAESALDEASLLAPLGEGRDTFVREREISAKKLIALLLRTHRTREAWLSARRSRGRVFSAMERAGKLEALPAEARRRWEAAIGEFRRERDALDAEAADDWKLSSQSLQAARAARKAREVNLRAKLDQALAVLGQSPRADADTTTRPGTLTLLFHPLDAGWVGFAVDADGVDGARIGMIDPHASRETLATLLLEPFHARVARAARVHLLAFGALRTIDLHALPFEGAPLSTTKAVGYALDLQTSIEASTSMSRALVVSDPTSDLAAAGAEGSSVEAFLRARSINTDALRGHAATSREVLKHLSKASLFHYAGHGAFGGIEGFDSALPLAAGSRIGVGDVLALPKAPRVVVLSACEGARTASNAAPEGLGLAQAFVAAGAMAVIAPTRAVPDDVAADLTKRLYEKGLDDDPNHAAIAYRDALRELRDDSPNADWAAFRFVTP